MNEQTRSLSKEQNGLIKPPAYPFSGRKFFHELRFRLGKELRREVTLKELSRLMGTPLSTTHHWLEVCPPQSVTRFMSLLEHLSHEQRIEFIETHCRTLPTLDHSKLRISPVNRACLYRLLGKKTGMTIITGGSFSNRTFLLTALGRSLPPNCFKCGNILGLDLNRPDAFVPIQSVCYIDGTQNLTGVRDAAGKVWPRILTSTAPVVLLNGVWSALPELRGDILRMTRIRHVILADHVVPAGAEAKGIYPDTHFITAFECKYEPGKVRVICRKKRP